ncbi:hypothetical protein AVEN_138234-1 [Araneus ventricosus]|uniref:Uncharacterized protein n=1 Tax=Araneus ventricosus TaxID=182803 RepID=A0A4Y2IRA2_ARAVE|nr:hypothetical protein AVEN_138234-1 [Araneus ventricosus]
MRPIDSTCYRTRKTNLLEKERANDKPAPHSDLLRMKRQWLHFERIISCPYSAILSIDRTLEMLMGFVCPQIVPWPCIFHFYSSKKLQGESFSFWQVSTNQLLNMRNFEWHCKMFRKILRNVLKGMSKVQEIPRALHVPKALLDASCNAVATSFTDIEAIVFLPLPHSQQMNPTFGIYQSSSSDGMQSSNQSRFLNPFYVRNFFNAITARSPFL